MSVVLPYTSELTGLILQEHEKCNQNLFSLIFSCAIFLECAPKILLCLSLMVLLLLRTAGNINRFEKT